MWGGQIYKENGRLISGEEKRGAKITKKKKKQTETAERPADI